MHHNMVVVVLLTIIYYGMGPVIYLWTESFLYVLLWYIGIAAVLFTKGKLKQIKLQQKK